MTDARASSAVPPAVDRAPCRTITLEGEVVGASERVVAAETAVQVSFASIPFAVMMLSPQDLEDFAYGFSLTEGMIERKDDIRAVSVEARSDGLALRIDLVGERLSKHLSRQRAMTGRTGCGVCGIDDIAALRRAAPARAKASPLEVAALKRALTSLDDRQVLNLQTRAVHAAAWADSSGEIVHVREDVGRHNALDKLIGALVRAGTDPASGFVVITSRCSFEMVEKTAAFGARTLVAISAPTSLAIERARVLEVALIAIARRDTVTIFNEGDHLAI